MMIKHMNSLQKLPLLLLMYIAAMLLLDAGGGDVWLAAKLYNLQGQQWLLQDHWLTEQVLHKGARTLNYVFCSVVLLLTLYRLVHYKKYPAKARRYAALSLSLIFSFALVAYLKSITNIACPWDLAMFGGTEPYYHLLQARPANLRHIQCFPAGHASVGYAWVALYFFIKQTASRWRYAGLAAGVFTGVVLGINQQIRGAHFLSHDVTTLLLCLLCAKICFMLFAPTRRPVEETASQIHFGRTENT
ncbi:phosphatase PAP2 family protein [Rheinheimera baltica]|uniref:phosphatase PAP2 family protein n=1 Tax=Rheinheimera baltica TaxID=67576 RepID=UPI00273E6F7B|nr:phosphatase PAP2 family protein [Rheinheimera baltica]MDP5141146.1 phosphatase PAP2 family protein [Rheinheimera baltica]MDP5148375.1 phosphatase PAP2 family protein [Rheinheimera baltica]